MTHPTHGLDPKALEATRERAQAALDSARATGPNSTSQTALEYRLAECIDVIAALSQNPGTSNTSGEADDFLSTTRDTLGRKVREVWVAWARTQPQPKPSWLVPYDELSEPDKEADRRIGEAIWSAGRQDVYDTLRYCEVKWSEERGTMLDTIQTLRSTLAALEPRASDREAVIEEIENAMLWFAHPLTDRKVLRFKAEQTAAAIRKLSEVSHEH